MSGTISVITLAHVRHSNKDFKPGDTIPRLKKDELERLVELGVVRVEELVKGPAPPPPIDPPPPPKVPGGEGKDPDPPSGEPAPPGNEPDPSDPPAEPEPEDPPSDKKGQGKTK